MYNKEHILGIIKKAKEGEEEAIQFLINQYKPFIIKECHKYKIPSYTFEDLIQYSYLTIINSIKKYKFGDTGFTTYVMKAITNNLGDLLRKNAKIYNELQEEEGFTMDYEDQNLNVENEVIRMEENIALNKAMKKLSKEEKAIIEDYYKMDMPLRLIAEKYGCTYEGIKKKKRRILNKIKNNF